MKRFNTCLLVLAFAASLSATAFAQEKNASAPVAVATKTVEMTDGEIRKVDLENKKITIKHGEIKNLDMPGMTMVFQVKDPAMLDKVKVGDKVKFAADKTGGAFVVTDIQANK
jgi:Cu(I)/Ag(I) efflux system periplasmic protein CusF